MDKELKNSIVLFAAGILIMVVVITATPVVVYVADAILKLAKWIG